MGNTFLQNHIDVSELKPALYSQITINQLIDNELRHDAFIIKTNENYGLVTMSNGQQKRALLTYIITQKPNFIILDDIYSNIDKETQISITETLQKLSEKTLLIQLLYRKKDLLTNIKTVLIVDENNSIIKVEASNDFLKQNSALSNNSLGFSLPKLFTERTSSQNPLIQFNSVHSSYGEKVVLKDINWTINSGEFWHLVGPNGSGKSTLLSLITGDNPRAYGENLVLFGKKKGTGETLFQIKKKIGYFTPTMIFQFNHDDTVENMIISGFVDSVGLYTVPSGVHKVVANEWLAILGDSFRHKTFRSLSMGQQRIVLIVRAMVKFPQLLILDEPTVGLDDYNCQLFISLINTIATEKEIAILYVSHRDEEGLKPDSVFELIPSSQGSTGIIR